MNRLIDNRLPRVRGRLVQEQHQRTRYNLVGKQVPETVSFPEFFLECVQTINAHYLQNKRSKLL